MCQITTIYNLDNKQNLSFKKYTSLKEDSLTENIVLVFIDNTN